MTSSLPSRIVAVASGRGGSGKTTVALALAHALRQTLGRRTALVDLDPQGSLATYLGRARSQNPLSDPPHLVHGIHLYAGGIGLGHATTSDVVEHIARATELADTVVVDCPPVPSTALHSAIWEYPVDIVLAVARLEPGSVDPLTTITGIAKAETIPYLVLPNMETTKPNALGTAIALQAIYAGQEVTLGSTAVPVLRAQAVPYTEHAPASICSRKPLTMFRPNSASSHVLADLAKDLVSWGVA